MLRRALNWTFRNRETGQITVAQRPNVALGTFLAAAVLRAIFEPAGTVGTVLDIVAAGALAWWAVDEIVRGVNPWRRALGLVALVLVLGGLARS